jgi:glucose 1-dehydrogenase
MSWLGLEDKVAVVTGAASGIGAGIALELARNGAHVAVLDLNRDGAEAIAHEIESLGRESIAVEVDTGNEKSVESAAREVFGRWDAIDILVNDAGTRGAGSLSEVSIADWRRVLDVNLTGYLMCSQRFGEPMRERKSGSIIHISSITGSNPQSSSGAYPISKAAVAMLSRTLAVEWGPDGVRSNSVAPGMTRTPFAESIYTTPGVLEVRTGIVPLRRIATPQDMANVCAWLASERSSYVTGQEITVDGGFTQTVMSQIPRPGH